MVSCNLIIILVTICSDSKIRESIFKKYISLTKQTQGHGTMRQTEDSQREGGEGIEKIIIRNAHQGTMSYLNC